MEVHQSNAPEGTAPSKFAFDGLSNDLQDKVYDFLDTTGIDDNLGKFVQVGFIVVWMVIHFV